MAQPNLDLSPAAERRLDDYLDAIAGVLDHADRIARARPYCTGLLLPSERKSVEPMAARLAPQRVRAAHQSLHHLGPYPRARSRRNERCVSAIDCSAGLAPGWHSAAPAVSASERHRF